VSETLQSHTTHLLIAEGELKTVELYTPILPERRRTPRRQVPIPLFVYGYTAEGHPFYEDTSTIAVNVHGGSMRMETRVQLGERLLVTNRRNGRMQPCIVVFLMARAGGGLEVAFSFTAAMPYFWQNLERGAAELEFEYPRVELLEQ